MEAIGAGILVRAPTAASATAGEAPFTLPTCQSSVTALYGVARPESLCGLHVRWMHPMVHDMQDSLHFPYQSKLGEFEEFTARAKLPALALAPSSAMAAAASSQSQPSLSQHHSQQQPLPGPQQQHAARPLNGTAPTLSQAGCHARTSSLVASSVLLEAIWP